ncbi:ABC transporter permease [Zooshikella harenae]|nr:ABC transporter permease [Zooshikella harenae]
MIELSYADLALCILLLSMLALFQRNLAPGLTRQLFISMVRMLLQLSIIGLVLTWLFSHVQLSWILGIALLMILAAGREANARQTYSWVTRWNIWISTVALFIATTSMLLLMLLAFIQATPWYHPQYFIPLLGMLLGNSLNGVSLAREYMTVTAHDAQERIEGQLMQGANWLQATVFLRRQAQHNAMIPAINSMAAAGIISLPGMMTGQILAGTDPSQAIRYQIVILILIAIATGLGSLITTFFTARQLFDKRQRLRLDRLKPARH